MKKYAFGIFFSGFATIFIAIGAWMAWSQGHKLSTWLPTEAKILSRKIETKSSSDGQTYAPVAKYTYTVNGKSYEGTQVTPLKEGSSQSWARGVLAQLPKGQKATAYYDPNNPADAFLVRRVSFFPYIFVLGPMIFVAIGLATILPAGSSLKIITAIWFFAGAVCAVHHLNHADKPDLLAKCALSFYGLIGFMMLYTILYKTREALTQRRLMESGK